MKPPPHIETVGTPGTISGFDYDWTFDGIGNRKKQSVSSTKVGHVATNLNQYSKTFNDTHGDGKQDGGEPRRLAGAETDHASHGPQGARAVRRRGRQSDLSNPIHDADGNMEQDANYDYTYDAEPERSGDRLPSFLNHRSQNRLIQRTPRNPSGNKMRLNFAYDYRGRRVEIISDYHTGSAWAVFYKETMLYDGWNPVMHYSYNDLYHGQTWVNRAYTWGLDLSGSLQGAGGVGGLLSVTGWLVRGSTSAASLRYYYTFDGNGNVSEVINYNNFNAYSMCAHHEYDAFGNLTRIDSGNGGWSIAATNPFRFSNKWHDLTNSQEEWGTLPLVHSLDPSKLYYYGYRFYAPEHGRWINRDPIGEKGGINPYALINNNSVCKNDVLGLSEFDVPTELPSGKKKYLHLRIPDCTITIFVGHGSGTMTKRRGKEGQGELPMVVYADGDRGAAAAAVGCQAEAATSILKARGRHIYDAEGYPIEPEAGMKIEFQRDMGRAGDDKIHEPTAIDETVRAWYASIYKVPEMCKNCKCGWITIRVVFGVSDESQNVKKKLVAGHLKGFVKNGEIEHRVSCK